MPSPLPCFQIHPADLLRRRERCRPLVEHLLPWERTLAAHCSICESPRSAILSTCDRYGFPARTALCLQCGLIYVVDRFTAKGYSKFYHDGCYRELIAQFKGKKQTLQRIDKAQVGYASGLIASLRGFCSSSREGCLLDIGGSTGYIAHEFQKHFGLRATVLEPSFEEAAMAKNLGLSAEVGSLETFDTDRKFDVILLCRTVEHLHDLKTSLAKIRGWLKPGGLFYCDIAEFMEILRREGPPEAITKIDHTYWLTQETAPVIFESLGFAISSVHLTLPPDQMGFVLRRSELTPEPRASTERLESMMRQFREIATDWHRFGKEPEDAVDWLKQRAYTLKKRMTK